MKVKESKSAKTICLDEFDHFPNTSRYLVMRQDEKKDRKSSYQLVLGQLASKPHALLCNRAGAGRAKGRKHYVYTGNPAFKVKIRRTRVRRNFDDAIDIFVEKCKKPRNGKGVSSTTQSLSFAVGRKHESKIVDFSLVLKGF